MWSHSSVMRAKKKGAAFGGRATVRTQNASPRSRPLRDSVTLRSAPRPKASVSFGALSLCGAVCGPAALSHSPFGALSQETIQGIRKRCGKRIADGTVGRIFQWDGAKSSYVIKATRGDFAQLRKECQSYDLVTRHNMKYVTRAIGYKIFQLTPEIDRHFFKGFDQMRYTGSRTHILFLILEKFDGTADTLKKQKKHLKREALLQLCLGLKEIHDAGSYHGAPHMGNVCGGRNEVVGFTLTCPISGICAPHAQITVADRTMRCFLGYP